VLLLSAANPDDISKEVSRPPNRLEYRPPLDLSLNRGLGFEVVGDGSGSLLVASFGKPRDRQYVVPLDFTGRRYVEIPHGQKSWSDGYWAKPHKWGKFDVVPEVNLWLGRIPANTGTRVAVEKLTALRELPQPLRNPGFRIGDGTLQVQGEIPSGAYLVYDGGDTATVFDANWHSLGERPVERSNWHAPSGPVQVELMTDQAGPLPWIKLRMYVTGAPMTFPISKPEEK